MQARISKETLQGEALELLKALIATPSYSREEGPAADVVQHFLAVHGVTAHRHLNNVWATSLGYDPAKPTLLLNSHLDTVRPNPGYTRDPFLPAVEDGRLYGLGSNDAGGALVGLIAAFVYFHAQTTLSWNLVLATTAEEEISGLNGIEAILPLIGPIDAAIVGEPTLLALATAEKGLLVLDCTAHGKAGHAARDEGENAIYRAVAAIEWFRTYTFDRVSPTLGPIKMSVTQIEAGTQHNVIPESCHFVVDIRLADAYTHEEVLAIINEAGLHCTVTPRSTRLRPSSIAADHPLVRAGMALGATCYGSPTTSDSALIPTPSLKLGPGFSGRSHTADEFIYLQEVEAGVAFYIDLLSKVLLP